MKALHRILVAGTIGALATATAASSGAFACTAQAGVKLAPPVKGYVSPNEALAITIQSFFDPADSPGATLVKVVLQAPDGTETLIAEQPGPGFLLEWIVPATVAPNPDKPYFVVASQHFEGTEYLPAGAQVWIANPSGRRPTSPSTSTPPPTSPPGSSVVPPPEEKPGSGRATEPVSGGLGQARGMTPGLPDTAAAAAPGASPPVSASTGGAAATARGGLDTASPPSEDRQGPVVAGVPELPADSLWSGLDGGSSPSLLDGAPVTGDGDGPLGAILLGGGAALLALAGLAAVVRRRRPVLARR